MQYLVLAKPEKDDLFLRFSSLFITLLKSNK